MDIEVKTTIDMLTDESVSILTQQYITIEGVETQVGENHRCAYINSAQGRADLEANEPEVIVNAVLTIWGTTPTIIEGVSSNE